MFWLAFIHRSQIVEQAKLEKWQLNYCWGVNVYPPPVNEVSGEVKA